MKITTDEIRKFTEVLCRHLDQAGKNEIDIEQDYYWEIDSSQLYQLEGQPNDLSIGQLSSNLEDLNKIVNDESLAVNYGFVWLSALLRYVGDQRE